MHCFVSPGGSPFPKAAFQLDLPMKQNDRPASVSLFLHQFATRAGNALQQKISGLFSLGFSTRQPGSGQSGYRDGKQSQGVKPPKMGSNEHQ